MEPPACMRGGSGIRQHSIRMQSPGRVIWQFEPESPLLPLVTGECFHESLSMGGRCLVWGSGCRSFIQKAHALNPPGLKYLG